MSNKIINRAISAVIAMSLGGYAPITQADGKKSHHQMGNIAGMEKCYGIAKAYRNDCGNSLQACAGSSVVDKDKEGWILVPQGLCNKIAGGSTKELEKA